MYHVTPIDELMAYSPDLPVPDDLAQYWLDTLQETAEHPLDVKAEPVTDTPLRSLAVYDVTFSGYGGQPIRAWYLVPRDLDGSRPTVIEYVGYGGGRGLPSEWLFWSAAGCPHMIMDTRGQGSAWRTGDTPDTGSSGSPRVPGFLTDGLPDRDACYYRRLFTDAVRAVDAAAQLPRSNPGRLVTTGTSQGGALAIVAASLHPGVSGAMPNVPFLCDIRRSAHEATRGPYTELVKWCHTHRTKADDALGALAYFDVAALAARATCPALFSVALRDETCPPPGVFACYNRYGGPKHIIAYEWNDHEGGEAFLQLEQAAWLTR